MNVELASKRVGCERGIGKQEGRLLTWKRGIGKQEGRL